MRGRYALLGLILVGGMRGRYALLGLILVPMSNMNLEDNMVIQKMRLVHWQSESTGGDLEWARIGSERYAIPT